MAVHVTRCPHCQTSFRVRDEHLSIAKGMVRCGSCLQVFKAADHFIEEESAAAQINAPEAAAQPAPRRPEAAQDIGRDDDDDIGLIHDDMDDDPIPEQLADDPFVDFNLRTPEHRARPKPRVDVELDESVFSLHNASSHSLDFLDDSRQDDGKAPDDDESWANALLEDDNGEAGKTLQSDDHDEFNFDLPPPEDDDFHGFLDDEETGSSQSHNMTLGGHDGLETETLEINIPVSRIDSLQEEPLQLNKHPHGRGFAWGWFSAAVVMLLIAAAQTFYFQFDHWARTPQWRPWYAGICELAGCQLPKVQDIRQMTTQHLMVRAHPDLQRALVVDTLLLNKADYEQPFPDLTLAFRDLNDNVVASRRFTPAQYLSGELTGQTDMPVRTPVHIALEIVDPGPEAVSYAIALQANQ